MRAVVPIIVPGFPFGLVLGMMVAESTQVSNLAGWSSSWLVLAGAAQMAAVVVLSSGGSAIAAVLSILVINSRHMMYSAAMSSRFRDAPMWFKVTAPYLMVDHVFAVMTLLPGDRTTAYRQSYFWGAGTTAWVFWQIAVGVGVTMGDFIPKQWSLGFAVPLVFLCLLVLAVRNLSGVVAAVVGGAGAVLARELPAGGGLLVGAVAGVAVATVFDIFQQNRGAR